MSNIILGRNFLYKQQSRNLYLRELTKKTCIQCQACTANIAVIRNVSVLQLKKIMIIV